MKTSKMKWLWENMKGYHGIYILAIFGAILYNVLQLTIPYVTQLLIDLFLSGRKSGRKKGSVFWSDPCHGGTDLFQNAHRLSGLYGL